METKTVDINELTSRFGELLADAKNGTEILIEHCGLPRARLVAMKDDTLQRIPNLQPGVFQMAADFDEPLPEEFWLGES